MVLSETAEVLYKATNLYAPQHERTILWNDPVIQIEWPATHQAILSAKDLSGVTLGQAEVYEQPAQPAEHTAAHSEVRQ